MNRNKVFLYRLVTWLAIFVLLGGLGFPAASAVAASPQAQTATTSVIVQARNSSQAAALVQKHGGQVTSDLEIIASVGALVPDSELAALRNDPGIVRVSPNAATALSEHSFDRLPANVPGTDYPDVTGANLAWQEGALGKGVTVAVIDTGIARHPSLMRDENGRPRKVVVGWVDFVDGRREPTDPNGHGTHIAGIIANAQKGPDGEYDGMAPAVQLVGIRVLDKTGAGNYEQVIKGIQWAVENKDRYGIKVINLSLHSLVQSPYWADPLNQAVMHAWADGIVVVVAAGNDGPKPMTISVPGNNPYVITVGAFTDNYTPSNWNDDYLADFSSAGPTLDGFVKPDLLAPGGHIVSTMLPGSYIARNHDANWTGGLYFSMAGTSQAAAVTTGAVAQVIGAHPELTPDQVKYRMMYTALPWVKPDQSDVLYSVWQQGAGRLNVVDAVAAKDITASANRGLDIQTDMHTDQHYEGYSYFNDTANAFQLHGFESLTGGYGTWAGGYGTWAGSYGSWADGYGTWAGGYGTWAGGYGTWAGGYGTWAGGYGTWIGGYGTWAGGYGTWAGGYGTWAGGYGVWAGQLTDPTFIANFVKGISPDAATSPASVGWVKDR